MDDRTYQDLIQSRAIAILRGDYTATYTAAIDALLAGGIRVIEFTLNSPGALDIIRDVNLIYGDRVLIGAGTVLEAEQARQVAKAGARFIVAPDFNPVVVAVALEQGVEPIPGVLTPSEATTAARAGARLLKLFPASLGGPDYLRQLRAPLNHLAFIATGGVTGDNAAEYLNAGAVAVGLGSWLVPARFDGTQAECDRITQRARQALDAVHDAD